MSRKRLAVPGPWAVLLAVIALCPTFPMPSCCQTQDPYGQMNSVLMLLDAGDTH